MDAAIEVRGLTKRYGDVVALDGLDLDVPAGSLFGFLGPNGAGKSTTIKILTSLAKASSGRASLAGVAAGDGEANRRGLIGYLDQSPRFNGWMRGREMLELVGRLSGMRGAELRSRVDEVLGLVGLLEAARRTIGGYSGGMRQRLGIAQAILARPPIVLLDEPVSALDPEGRRDMLETISGLRAHSTVLLSSHVLTDIERICDRVAIIDAGRLVTESAVPELLERYAMPVYRLESEADAVAALSSLADAMRGQPWITSVDLSAGVLRVGVGEQPDAGQRLLAMVVEHRLPLVALERVRPSLEDVFLRLTGRAAKGDAM
jgi:ABC-2 type transport system ATP-binding protein